MSTMLQPIKVPTVVSWWQVLGERDKLNDDLTDEEWYCGIGREVRELLCTLEEVVEENGATRPRVEFLPDGSWSFGTAFDPTFDWKNGEIDFAPRPDAWGFVGLRGDELITRIARVTSIPAS